VLKARDIEVFDAQAPNQHLSTSDYRWRQRNKATTLSNSGTGNSIRIILVLFQPFGLQAGISPWIFFHDTASRRAPQQRLDI
jgi:hypothetical protein